MIIFATILLVSCLLVAIGLFLVKIGKGSQRPMIRVAVAGSAYNPHLWLFVKRKLGVVKAKLWHFILEAKDLKPATTKTLNTQVEKVRNAFRIRIRGSETDPSWLPEAATLTANSDPNQKPEDLYLESIKKNPNDVRAYESLGRLYLQNKNYPDAIETYEYLTKLNPSRDGNWSNLGFAYYSTNNFSKAAESYEKALSINSKIATRWINLALCYEALSDHGKAVKALVAAVELDKLNVNFLMMLAEEYIKIPNLIRAEEVLEQILALEPTNRQARERLMKLKI